MQHIVSFLSRVSPMTLSPPRLAPILLLAVGCAPPSLRHAHSLDQGDIAIEVAGALDNTMAEAHLLGTSGDATVESTSILTEQLTGDAVFRVGLGYGFEVGANTFGGHVKYSALDERRHEGAPLSVALTGQLGLRYAGGGLLVSKQLDAGAMQVRPVVNVWYQSHYLPVSWAMPEDMTDAEDPIENPGVTDDDSEGELGTGLYATVGMQEVYIPIGVELPIALNDDWDLVPFAAYALSIPVDSWSTNILCYDCFAGLEDISLARRSHLWVGVKFQPPLRRPGAPTTEESP